MATEPMEGTPGLARDLPELLSAWERLDAETKGQIVFVAGEPGSGRSELLSAFTEELMRRGARPTVVAGAFTTGRFLPFSAEPLPRRVTSILDRLLGLGAAAAVVADGVVPYAGLMAQVLSKSQAAVELAESVLGDGEHGELPRLLPRVLRRLCEDKGRVACIVDNADQAPDGWWADLVLLFGRSIARDLPLLLVLGVDGPRVLGQHHADEPSMLFAARQLVSGGLASWGPVEPVTIRDVQQWTGPATQQVLRSLLDVTGGRAGWAAQLWRDWQRRGIVDQTSEDVRWRFVDRSRALDSVEDLFGERLRRRLGPSDLAGLDKAYRVLACAALEGRRFTAEAIGLALGVERNELLDFLDDDLATQPDAMLQEEGSVDISDEAGDRSLWLYRFVSELDWLTLRYRGLTRQEQLNLSLRLADALAEVYGGEAYRVAATLAHLYDIVGDRQSAQHYRHMSEIGISREFTIWRARTVLDAPTPAGEAERTQAAQIVLAGARELFHTGPFQDGLSFAQRARELAVLQSDRAEAVYLTAIHQLHLRDYDAARSSFDEALDLAQHVGSRQKEASARHGLAAVDYEQGNYDNAEVETLLVLDLNRELADKLGEVRALQQLGNIGFYQDDYEKAEVQYVSALDLAVRIADRQGEGSARHMLGRIEISRGEYEKAATAFRELLEFWREHGNPLAVARARGALAELLYLGGAYNQAEHEYLAVAEAMRELGDRRDEMRARRELVNIYRHIRCHESARRQCLGVLDLARAIGDQETERMALRALREIEDDRSI